MIPKENTWQQACAVACAHLLAILANPHHTGLRWMNSAMAKFCFAQADDMLRSVGDYRRYDA